MLKRQVAVLATLFCFLAPAGAFAQGALARISHEEIEKGCRFVA